MNPKLHFAGLHRRWLVFVSVLVFTGVLGGSVGLGRVGASADWQFADRHLRLPLSIGAGGYARTDKVADVPVDFTALLAGVGVSGSFDPTSLRVVEVNDLGVAQNTDVPFQFDPAPDYSANSNAQGTLVVLLTGQTSPNATRLYQIYFDIVGAPYTPPTVTPQLTFTDGVSDEGFASYKFETPAATYFYHKQGGGFSSLVDSAGNDWISWNSATGAAGDFRGIPNLVNPTDGGYFHPGRTTSTSSVVNQGPLKTTIKSVSSDKRWETVWAVYPTYARMTVTKADGSYWFLYEGTPGGQLENSDRVVRSNAAETAGLGSWLGDISGEEWVYFKDASLNQSLFVAHEQEDALTDSYRPLDNVMTVFGFGRNEGSRRYLKDVPQHFVIGLANETNHAGVGATVHDAYKPLATSMGTLETTYTGPICDATNERIYFSAKSAGSVPGVARFEDEDVVVYDGATCEWSLAFDGSIAGLPANARIDGLEADTDGSFYFSFDLPLTIPGVGKVDDSDIVHYTGGVFSLWFDGSLVGLTTAAEDVDAIAFDPQGNLILSTMGSFAVPGPVRGADEDLLRLSAGTWSLVFDGSHNAGLAKEDIDGVAWLPDGSIRLSVLDAFAVGPVAGDGSDIVTCVPVSLGFQATTCTYSLAWDGSARGPATVNAFAVVPIAVP